MEEATGSQYALHIALQTLKERCQNLQQRLIVLEEENTSLRVRCNECESKNGSLTEVDVLKARITRLIEQKVKLKSNLVMVANENRQLWTQLSNLSQVNKSIGSHLTKINESLKQHTKTTRTALVRSNTFTQSEQKQQANKAIVENDRISLELEDISLKLISNIAREKSELEAQCTEMAEMQNTVMTNSFGFSFMNDDTSDSLAEEFSQHLAHLRHVKDELQQQKEKLQKNVDNIRAVTESVSCAKCLERGRDEVKKAIEGLRLQRKQEVEEEQQLESLAKWGTSENSNSFLQGNASKTTTLICPMCGQVFYSDAGTTNLDFLQHVENHFVDNRDNL